MGKQEAELEPDGCGWGLPMTQNPAGTRSPLFCQRAIFLGWRSCDVAVWTLIFKHADHKKRRSHYWYSYGARRLSCLRVTTLPRVYSVKKHADAFCATERCKSVLFFKRYSAQGMSDLVCEFCIGNVEGHDVISIIDPFCNNSLGISLLLPLLLPFWCKGLRFQVQRREGL